MRRHKWNKGFMTSMLPIPEGLLEPHDFFEKFGRFSINFPDVNTSTSEYFYHLEIALPGYSKEDFEIEVTNKMLTVFAKEDLQENDEGKVYQKHEITRKPFKRSFHLPENVNISKIEARYRNGILYIDMPKVVKKEVDKKHVEVM